MFIYITVGDFFLAAVPLLYKKNLHIHKILRMWARKVSGLEMARVENLFYHFREFIYFLYFCIKNNVSLSI